MSGGSREKAEALAPVYQYVASRLEPVDQRCSVLMILSGSFVSYMLTAKNIAIGAGTETLFAIAYRPSIVGVLAFLCFFLSQSICVRQRSDLISLIVFSKTELSELIDRFNGASPEAVLAAMISNQRLIGQIFAIKGRYCNFGAIFFCLSAVLQALQR
jgi:hypothetical protein